MRRQYGDFARRVILVQIARELTANVSRIAGFRPSKSTPRGLAFEDPLLRTRTANRPGITSR